MPRQYGCKKCGHVHSPPTGKKCRFVVETEAQPEEDMAETASETSAAGSEISSGATAKETTTDLLPLLLDIRAEMTGMKERLTAVETRDAAPQKVNVEESADSEDSELPADPAELRRDKRAIRRAAERIAKLTMDDSDDDDIQDGRRIRGSSMRCLGRTTGYNGSVGDSRGHLQNMPPVATHDLVRFVVQFY